MAELRTHHATERVRVVTLRLTQTRPSSIPTIDRGSPPQSHNPNGVRQYGNQVLVEELFRPHPGTWIQGVADASRETFSERIRLAFQEAPQKK